ncbi:hypothetical protein TrLO_g3101 [Triparma laevis f. longispina]|uniref:Anaphase-promoting complex subunit 5 n=1 Tax=Triparma laevis f. longispina TaxID=1714387 RepID=A0A9W7KVH1_9STRA|nr:hypothetical protein TrLO_g3101 [Triparma laevis f. longispina]
MSSLPSPFSWCLAIIMARTSPPPLGLIELASGLMGDSLLHAPSLKSLMSSLPNTYKTILLSNLTAHLPSFDSFSDSFLLLSSSVGCQPTSDASPITLPPPNSSSNMTLNVPSSPTPTPVEGCSGLDPKSTYGIYIRKISLGFDKLPFETACKLYIACQAYVKAYDDATVKGKSEESTSGRQTRSKSRDIFARLNDKISGTEPEVISGEPEMEAVGVSPLLTMCSPGSISEMVRMRALKIEGSIGRVHFHETEAAIANLLNYHPEQALSHYLRYLNCLHHKEFPGALDSLHRYFDYAMVEKWGKDFVQYAIINLAALHHNFGHRGLSLLATDEAVRVAQQNGDGACVAYALAWLHHNGVGAARSNDRVKRSVGGDQAQEDDGEGGGEGGEGNSKGGLTSQTEELLERCSARALEHELHGLAATASLALSTHACKNMASDKIWESLDEMNRNAIVGASTSIDEVCHINSRKHLVAAAAWETFGKHNLGIAQSQAALDNYGESMTSHDYTLAVCKIACGMLRGVGVAKNANVHEAALSTLVELRERYPISVVTLFPHVYCSILHDRELKQGRLASAESVGVMLRSVSLMQGHGSGVELWVGSAFQFVELLAKQKLWAQARTLCERGAALSAAYSLRVMQAKFLLQQAKLTFESSFGNVVGVLPSLWRSIHLSEQICNETLRASGLLLVAKVFVGLGTWKRAKVMLTGRVIGVLEEGGEVEEVGEAWLCLAKCEIMGGDGVTSVGGGGRRESFWRKALGFLDKAIRAFGRVGSKDGLAECLLLKSLCSAGVGDAEVAKEAASQWKEGMWNGNGNGGQGSNLVVV